jgi:UDP-N-acetylmuramyl pentapeptide phosphotransferase/UDP-N-acetylglucosamine-1-phosphate transferase
MGLPVEFLFRYYWLLDMWHLKMAITTIFLVSLSVVGAIAGFFLLNYLYRLLFLGGCGAYLIGFLSGVLSILLVKNNPNISTWLPVGVSIYPIYEILFSIY